MKNVGDGGIPAEESVEWVHGLLVWGGDGVRSVDVRGALLQNSILKRNIARKLTS